MSGPISGTACRPIEIPVGEVLRQQAQRSASGQRRFLARLELPLVRQPEQNRKIPQCVALRAPHSHLFFADLFGQRLDWTQPDGRRFRHEAAQPFTESHGKR